MTKKLSINFKIDGRIYPLTINEDDEEKHRKAVKIINDIVLQYRKKYVNVDSQNVLAMTAFQYVLKSIELEENVSDSGLFDELKQMDEDLGDYLSLKE